MKQQKTQNKTISARFCSPEKDSKLLTSRLINLTLIFALMLSTSAFSEVGASAKSSFADHAQTLSLQQEKTGLIKDKPIPEENVQALKKLEKKGEQNGFIKFLTAMLGVLVSAAAIFFGLRLYKKLFLKEEKNLISNNSENSLHSPKDFKEAINLFLNKTDK